MEPAHEIVAGNEQVPLGHTPAQQRRGLKGQPMVDDAFHRRQLWVLSCQGGPIIQERAPERWPIMEPPH
jgi:hypothetical protein